MNAKKAKKLRKIVGFDPKAPRQYDIYVKDTGLAGLLEGGMTGQVTARGARTLYQAAKKRIRWD